MIKKLTMTLGCVASALAMSAAPITPEQALDRMGANMPAKMRGVNPSQLKLAYTAKSETGSPVAYLFTKENADGFTLLSADDIAVPVLGYSDTGKFDPNNMPSSMKWWLNEYARKIEYMASKGVDSKSQKPYAPAEWKAIAPLMTTIWNQDAPYNRMTPVIGNVQTPTGCVATSFAQVMNYFKYPEMGNGVVRYTASSGKVYTMVLANNKFEWDKMLDNYVGGAYTDAQADAVAFLMKACGYTVEMNYGTAASGTQSYKLATAAVNYFNYDSNIEFLSRNFYSTDQWTTMVYENILNIGPVIYNGTSVDGGHSFVCDGYDGNGYFHFNWGWGGMSDGYYVLDSLNPGSQGIGGAEGGFNYSQDALFKMQKPTGEPTKPVYDNMKVFGNVTATLTGNNIKFGAKDSPNAGWGNAMYKGISCYIGAIIENIDNPSQKVEVLGGMGNTNGSAFNLGLYAYVPTANSNPVVAIPSNLADGKYKVIVAAKATTPGAPWQPMLVDYGNVNYCYLTIENGVKTVTNATPATFTFEEVGFTSPLYYGRNAHLQAKVKNTTDIQITRCLQPILSRNGKRQFQGDVMLLTVDAGDEVVKDWKIAFYPIAGADAFEVDKEYELSLFDKDSGISYGPFGSYPMGQASAGFTLKLNSFDVANAEKKDITVGTRTFKNAYLITNPDDFTVELDYTVSKGYFDQSIRVGYATYNVTTNSFVNHEENLYYATPFLLAGNTENVQIPMSMDGDEIGTVHMLVASYIQNGANKTLGMMYIGFPTSGIDDVITDEDSNVEYFNLAGTKVLNPSRGDILIKKIGDKVSKIIF